MDRKKTIVAAAMINAGILTVLFIAAMTMREDPVPSSPMIRHSGPISNDPKPLYEEPIATLAPTPLVMDAQQPSSNPPVAFSLPPVALVEPKPASSAPLEKPSAPLAVNLQPASAPLATSFSATEIEVQKGDSLEKLAKKHRTSVDEIIKLNQLPSSFLRVGQKLMIPAEKSHEIAAKPKPSLPLAGEQPEYYTMKVGDNPWSIAMKHHMKVDELLKLNGLNDKTARKLKPGDRLRIK